ncbi:MAG: alpha/beta hydrolase [Desulfobacterales bacterium]
MASPVMKEAKGDGVKIALALWEGAGKTVLCVHGLTANCRCWDAVAESLFGRHRVLAVDLRGRGFSQKPSSGYSVDHHVRDLICLMDDLKLATAVIAGHSLGATIALAAAAAHSERIEGVILVDGAGTLSTEQMGRVFAGIKPSLDRLGKVFPSFEEYKGQLRKAPFLDPWSGYLETYFRYEVEEVDGGVRSRVEPGTIAEEIENMKGLDVARFYPAVACPVLIVRAPCGMLADDDILLPEGAIQRMLREIPDARRADVPGANHYSIVLGESRVRDDAILAFLDSLG